MAPSKKVKEKGGKAETKKEKKRDKQLKKKDKTVNKTLSKKEKKQKREKEEEDEDIDALLAQFEKQTAALVAIAIEPSAPPSRRLYATLSANPIDTNELILFGGELFDGQKCHLFNDLFLYNVEKNEWRLVTSPNSPTPRSSHQIVFTPAGRGFLFGGEYISPSQSQFYHYKDFWSLDLKTYAWDRLEVGKKPSPRSGHRMVLWKHFIVLFGGFYDANETRYLDDLWIYDTTESKWQEVKMQEPRPTRRSGCQMVVEGDTVVLYGGYTKEFVKGEKARGVVHTDCWHLKMGFELDKLRWERKKKGAGVTPPPRSGAAMVCHKGRGYMFGGVVDVKEDDETIESICSDELLQLNFQQNRFYPVAMRLKGGDPSAAVVKPSPRFSSMMAVQRSSLYIFGGVLEKGNQEITFADLFSLDLDKLNGFQCRLEDADAVVAWKGGDEESGPESEEDGDDDDDDDDGSASDGDSDDDSDEVMGDAGQCGGSAGTVAKDRSRAQADDIIMGTAEDATEKAKTAEASPSAAVTPIAADASEAPAVISGDVDDPSEPQATDETLKAYFERTSLIWIQRVIDASPDERAGSKSARRAAFLRAEECYEAAAPRLEREREQLRLNEVSLEEAKRDEKKAMETRSRRI